MEKAEGVPLFIEEVTKTLLDLGVLRREDGGFRVVRGLAEVSVPDTIQGIIMARLDRLGEDGKRAVQLAAVIGRQFLLRLLDRVAGMADRLEGLVQELKALEIVYEQGLLPEPAYVFKHAVIQDVAYNSLLRERRRELHRAVGSAIEELYADRLAEHYEELAHHFSQGEDWPKAFEYLVRSADRAKDAFANRLALDHYARALEAAARLSPPVAPRRLLEIHQKRAQVWLLLTRCDDAVAEGERMLAIARAAGDRPGEAEALLELALAHWATLSHERVPAVRACAEAARGIAGETGDRRALARSLWALGAVDQTAGQLEEADRKFRASLEIAEADGFRSIAVQSRMMLGAHAYWRGDLRAAIALGRDTERAAADVHDGFHELVAIAFVVLAHITLGEYAEGRAALDDGLRKARERDNAFAVGRLTNSLGWLHQELADFRRALDLDQESADIGRRIKNPNVEISALINVGYDHLHLGAPRRGLEVLEEALGRIEKFGYGAHRWRWSMHALSAVAEALLLAGEPGRALAQAERALVEARATDSRKYMARAHLLRGQIALASGGDTAGAELAEALRLARQIGYPTLTWQAAHLLGVARAAAGQPAEAAALAGLASETIAAVAGRAPEPALREAFLASPRVQAAREDVERLLRG